MSTSEMSTSETVDALLELQRIDARIDELRKEMEGLEPEVRDAETRVREIRRSLEEARAELDEAEKAHRGDQRSIDAGRETLRRLKERSDDVQNMKQHKAVRAELATARKNLQAAEEEAFESMQRMEDAQDRVEELEEELDEAREEHRQRAEEVEGRSRELEEELTEREERRERYVERIDDEVVSMYERVRKGTTDDVLAPLSHDHCGHCFTMVPPQRRNEILAGRSLHRCEGCGVILHAPDAGSG